MHPAPCRADERAFEVQPQDFRSRVAAFVLLTDVLRDAFDTAHGIIRVRCDGGGYHRCGSMPGHRAGHRGQGLGAALHHVVPARAVNVHVDKAGHRDFVERGYFLRPRRQRQ